MPRGMSQMSETPSLLRPQPFLSFQVVTTVFLWYTLDRSCGYNYPALVKNSSCIYRFSKSTSWP